MSSLSSFQHLRLRLEGQRFGIVDTMRASSGIPAIGTGLDRSAELVARMQSQIPWHKLAVFVRTYERDEVVTGLALQAVAVRTVALGESDEGTQAEFDRTTVPLGQLTTDHVGYASFDLSSLRDLAGLLSVANALPERTVPADLHVTIELRLLPFGDPLLGVDVMAEADIGADVIVLRHQIEEEWLLERGPELLTAAMQSPDLTDWRLSPGSFAVAPGVLTGEPGCEQYASPGLSSLQYRFHQPVRRFGTQTRSPSRSVHSMSYGYLLEFRTQWFPIGHSLGQMLYSLPLAPAERVNLAIIDWSRADTAARDESTRLEENLVHDQQRDRTIDEVVEAAVREHQSGSSAMAGLGASIAVPLGSAILGGSLGLGATTTSSEGTRDISAETTQRLSDAFHQASAAVRQLRSTVVTQASQAENGRFETRTIANYNHCHTLTITYHEVLRHYRVVSSGVARRPVLFVEFAQTPSFDLSDESVVRAHRAVLERVLLDPRHRAGFEALARKRAAELALAAARAAGGPPPLPAAQAAVTRMLANFRTGDNPSDARVSLSLRLRDGTAVRCEQTDPPPNDRPFDLDDPNPNRDDREAGAIDTYVVRPEREVRRDEVAAAEVYLHGDGDGAWRLASLRLLILDADGTTTTLVDAEVDQLIHENDPPVEVPAKVIAHPAAAAPSLMNYVAPGDLAAVSLLIEHLQAYRAYYRAALVSGSDPVSLGDLLSRSELAQGTSLADLVDSRILGHDGRDLILPLTPEGNTLVRNLLKVRGDDEPDLEVVAEDLIALPTRGVFAEGKLGRCSTCEVVDDTRFWDWQTSPIPDAALSIAPLDTSSRFQAPAALGSSAFPAGIVNITNPQPAPDPVAIGAALQVLSSDVFRDMSGAQPLGQFLTSVVQGTAGMVNAMGGNRREQELVKQIGELPDLTGDQKAALLGQILGKPPAGEDGGPAPGTPGPQASGGGSVPAAEGAAPQKSQKSSAATATVPARPAKPRRPKPVPPGKLIIMVAASMGGHVPLADLEGQLDLTVAGPESQFQPRMDYQPMRTGALSLVYDETAGRSGILVVRLRWEEIIHIRNPEPGPDGRTPIAAGGSVEIESNPFPFTFADGASVAQFEAVPAIKTTKVTATSTESAKLAAKTELGVDVEIFKIAGGLETTVTGDLQQQLEYVVSGVGKTLVLTQRS